MDKPLISEFCVYAIRHTDELESKCKDGGKGTCVENKRWVDGCNLFRKAQREHKQMPILFGRAEKDSDLIFYATLESVQVNDEAKTTTYSFTGLTRINEPLPLRTLIKKNDGKALSDDFIKSYVICHTPEYLLHAPDTMKHFVGYHSTEVMGHELTGGFTFASNKPLGYLENTINSRIWMICGTKDGRGTLYRLVGYYIADGIRKSGDRFDNIVFGSKGLVLGPPVDLNNYEWFRMWLRSKFYSLGLHEIKFPQVVTGLEQLVSCHIKESRVACSKALFPEEVEQKRGLIEGAVKQIMVNAYERNEKARMRCIEHYGLNCYVCGFNFEETYGDAGVGLIHVHHLKSLSAIGERYEVDPIKDLRPICPNCHMIVHSGTPMFTLEQVREMLERPE